MSFSILLIYLLSPLWFDRTAGSADLPERPGSSRVLRIRVEADADGALTNSLSVIEGKGGKGGKDAVGALPLVDTPPVSR